MAPKIPAARPLETVLLDGKSVFRKAALGGDTIIDAAVINASVPDSAANKAAKKAHERLNQDVSPAGVNAAFNLVNNERTEQKKPGLSFIGTEEVEAAASRASDLQSAAPVAVEAPMDQAAKVGEKVMQYGGYALIGTEIVPMVAGGAASLIGLKGLSNALHAPQRFLENTKISKNLTGRQALNDGVQLGFSALQTYGVAKGFNDNMIALKEMYTDITGQEAPSTMQMLTGEMPPALVETRSHFIKEYGIRGALQVAGWGLMIRDLLRGHLKDPEHMKMGRIGMAAGILPSIASMGVDMLMGTAATEVYTGFKKAVAANEAGPNEYAAFLLASSPDLAKHKVAKQVAMQIGTEYAEQRTPPGEILRQISDGRFNAKIEQLIAKDEAQLAAPLSVTAEPPKELTMVEKLGGAKAQSRPKLGHFTGMVAEQGGLRPEL